MYILSLGILILSFLSLRKQSNSEVVVFNKNATNQAKGLAIVLVIIGHLNTHFYDWKFMKEFGTIGVAVFLFSSGYGLVKSYQNNGLNNFGRKRVLSVYLPYLIITLVWLALDFIIHDGHSMLVSALALLAIDFTRSVDGTMWYVTFIFYWYLAFYISFKLFRNDIAKVISLFFFSGISIIFWYLDLLGTASIQWGIHGLIFPLGVVYAFYIEGLIKKTGIKFALLLFVSTAILYAFNYQPDKYSAIYLLISDILGMVLIVLLFMITEKVGLQFRFLGWVGLFSYELYLVEGYLIDELIISDFGQNSYALLVYVLAVIVSVMVLNRLIKLANKLLLKS